MISPTGKSICLFSSDQSISTTVSTVHPINIYLRRERKQRIRALTPRSPRSPDLGYVRWCTVAAAQCPLRPCLDRNPTCPVCRPYVQVAESDGAVTSQNGRVRLHFGCKIRADHSYDLERPDNDYCFWGPGAATGEVVIRRGGSIESPRQYYGEVRQAAVLKMSIACREPPWGRMQQSQNS